MENGTKVKMPYKTGKGVNRVYLCEKCFSNTKESQEIDIEKYKNKQFSDYITIFKNG